MKPTLAEIVQNKREELDQRRRLVPQKELLKQAAAARGNFLQAITEKRVNLIAELKPKSPSLGTLRDCDQTQLDVIAALYSKYAAAISVLTDQRYFGGSIELLAHLSARLTTPLLCKDFIVDPYQVFEARAAGAEAILLIAKILTDAQLRQLQSCAQDLNMQAVVEVQTESELQRALAVEPKVLLINNRDLSTFAIDLSTTERLAAMIPAAVPFICASGIESADDIRRFLPLTSRFLVGSSIMRAENVEAKLIELSGVPITCAG
jgi:indole-3-glycerol phosphate synthase